MVNWAEREPQRDIYLVVNGAGLREEQLSELEQAVSPVSNIKVIDFNTIPLQELEEIIGGSASTLRFSRPAQRSLTLRPAYC